MQRYVKQQRQNSLHDFTQMFQKTSAAFEDIVNLFKA